jgi:antitoxin (DNA-binding transcriptional repressor) of toxin-antitoxin stability system
MKTVAIENAHLPDLLIELRGEDEIVLTDHCEPVARLVSIERRAFVPSAASLQNRSDALRALRELGGLRDVIHNPEEWQRAIREDRPLPLMD